MGRLAIVALIVGACGHPKDPVKVTPGSGGDQAKLPDGAPLVTPGERMSYKLVLQGVSLAEYTFGAGDMDTVNGKPVVLVQGHAKTVGLADFVAKIDDSFTSWVDVSTGRSLRFQVDEYAVGSKTDIEHTIIDFGARTENVIPVTFHLNAGAPAAEPQKVSYPEVWDTNAFLLALRSWEAPVGTTASVEVFRSRYLWHVDVRVGKREKIATELADLSDVMALRFDAHTYKLKRDGTKDPESDERNFTIWISDDDGRVPLQIVARTDYGDMKMKIVDYQPGSGQRIRK